jgi:hypothetical protein
MLTLTLNYTRSVSFQSDGSFFVIESDSEYVLSRAIGESFAASDAWGGGSTTVIAGQCGAALDEGFQSVDLPTSGSSNKSQWRPAAQVLRLTLSLVWKPLDPQRLLEFLTHPVSPLRQPLRSRLAKVVANTPGIGGQDWERVIDTARAEAIEKAGGDINAAKVVDEQLHTWLLFPRFDPEAGAPVALLGNIVRVLQVGLQRGRMFRISMMRNACHFWLRKERRTLLLM